MEFSPVSPEGRFAVVDVETTGFHPILDRVVDMACVVIEGRRIVSRWSTLVDPERPIPAYATRVHGLSAKHVRGAPRFWLAQRELVERCGDGVIVAHNAGFDRSFLPGLALRPWVCTLAYARRVFPNAPDHRNQTLRAYLAIDEPAAARGLGRSRSALAAHRALGDAVVTAEILLRCMDRLSPKARIVERAA